MENIEKEFLSIPEFACLLNIHQSTVRRSIKKGRISAFKVGSGKKSHYRIPKSEISRIALFDMEEMIKQIIDKRLNQSNGILET